MASTTSPTLLSGAGLPRFVALQLVYGLPGFYLAVDVRGGKPHLTFSTQMKSRMVAHEVLYNADEAGVAILRAPNGRFWQVNEFGYIVADRETTPFSPTSDPECYFKLFRNATGHLLFQTVLGGKYLRWLDLSDYYDPNSGSDYNVPNSFHASASDFTDLSAAIRDTSAVDDAVVLPRYVMFLGDNNMYVGNHNESDRNWLKFSKESPQLSASHEIIPLLDGNVVVRSIGNQKFWRRSPDWIWADVDNLPDAQNDIECHFDMVKLSSTMLAFRSLANNRLLKRYSKYWDNMLCANGSSIDDTTARLIVKEAALSRKLFNIKYLLNLAEVTEITPVLVGSGSMFNNSDLTTDLQIQVTLTQSVSNTQMWSTSNTFGTSFTVSFTAGVPEVASATASITLSSERTITTEMDATISNSLTFQSTYTVKDVPPRTEAKVEVQCTTAKCRVPFTYTSKDTRIDGIEMPSVENIDGIFEGVNAFNIRGIVTTVTKNDTKSGGTKNILQVSENDTKSGGLENILVGLENAVKSGGTEKLLKILF